MITHDDFPNCICGYENQSKLCKYRARILISSGIYAEDWNHIQLTDACLRVYLHIFVLCVVYVSKHSDSVKHSYQHNDYWFTPVTELVKSASGNESNITETKHTDTLSAANRCCVFMKHIVMANAAVVWRPNMHYSKGHHFSLSPHPNLVYHILWRLLSKIDNTIMADGAIYLKVYIKLDNYRTDSHVADL